MISNLIFVTYLFVFFFFFFFVFIYFVTYHSAAYATVVVVSFCCLSLISVNFVLFLNFEQAMVLQDGLGSILNIATASLESLQDCRYNVPIVQLLS
jgi:hypothetical protein